MITDNIKTAVAEALQLLPAKMSSAQALVQLYAIGLQESRFEHRYQLPRKPGGPKGPARGFWQFERGGAVTGVLEHAATRQLAEHVCTLRGVEATPNAVWLAIEHDDVLAACFARLNMWWSPHALPPIGDAQAAWEEYIFTWRPGDPHRRTWDAFYAEAVAAADRRKAAR